MWHVRNMVYLAYLMHLARILLLFLWTLITDVLLFLQTQHFAFYLKLCMCFSYYLCCFLFSLPLLHLMLSHPADLSS